MNRVDAREAFNPTETRVIRVRAPGADDITLGLLERRGERVDARLPPVLLVHGATFGATLFDLPLSGYSLMAELAKAGRAVYAVDIRGFGHSLNGAVMNAPPHEHRPFPQLSEAVSDIGAAVDAIRGREKTDAVDIVGFSWGTITSARYATEHPERVARLALYAPLFAEFNAAWLDRIADPKDATQVNPSFGAYRLMTQADLNGRWNNDLPTGDVERYREAGLPEIVFRSLAALDPGARQNGAAAFRCPTGALVDLVSVFNGRPLYDPGKIGMPTLLIRGADDTTSTDFDARRLLAATAAREKEYHVIDPGSHFLLIERNRTRLYERLNIFLQAGRG